MKQKIHEYQSRQYMLSSNYEIYHYQNQDLIEVSLHHHDFYECYFLLSGSVDYLIEGKTYYLQKGDLVLINCRELHQAKINPGSHPYERIVLWINRSFLNELISLSTELAHCFEAPDRMNILRAEVSVQKAIEQLLHKLLSLEGYQGVGYDVLYRAYLMELIVHMNNAMRSGKAAQSIDMEKSSLIDGIVDYISEHIHEDITLDTLSSRFYLSKYHLLRVFKKHTGTTLHRYIIQKKLIEAKELILTNVPITEVYQACGFGDYSNFFRAFKNEYGLTPKQFYEAMSK